MQLPYRYRILVFLFSLIFVTYLDRICIGLVSDSIISEFNLTNTQWGWIGSAFAISYAAFEIPSGIWGDKIGQRAVFIRIVLWWSLFTVLTGFTTGFISLLVVRFLFGMGEAGAFPNSSGVVSRWFPSFETARGMTATQLGMTTGSALAPFIVLTIATAYGWRTSFFVNGAIGLIWVLVCYFWFRNNPGEMKHISAEEKEFIEKNRRFTHHKQDFPWKAAIQNFHLWALVLQYFCSQWATYFFITWMPRYLTKGRGFSEHDKKWIVFFIFAAGFLGALISGSLIDGLVKRRGLRFGRRFAAILSLCVQGITFLVCAITPGNWVAVASLVLGALFWTPAVTTSFSTCIDIGGGRAATVAGIMNFFGYLGAFFLSFLFGMIVDATNGNYNTPLYMLAGVMFIGALFWLAVMPDKALTVSANPSQPIEVDNHN